MLRCPVGHPHPWAQRKRSGEASCEGKPILGGVPTIQMRMRGRQYNITTVHMLCTAGQGGSGSIRRGVPTRSIDLGALVRTVYTPDLAEGGQPGDCAKEVQISGSRPICGRGGTPLVGNGDGIRVIPLMVVISPCAVRRKVSGGIHDSICGRVMPPLEEEPAGDTSNGPSRLSNGGGRTVCVVRNPAG